MTTGRVALAAALLSLLAGSRVAAQDAAALVAQLASDDARTRSDAYTKLMRERSPEAMALVAKALPTLPLAGQSLAVYVLQGYQGDDALAAWKKLAGQGGAFVQAAAAAELWRRGDKSQGPALAAAIKAAPAAERGLVLGRLYGIEDAGVVAAVRGLVRTDVEPSVVGDALFHLLQWQKGADAATAAAAEALLGGAGGAAAMALVYLVASGSGQQHGAALAEAIRDEQRLPQYQLTRFLERAARLDAAVVDAIVARLEQTKVEYDVTRFVQLLQKHAPTRIEPALRGHLDGDPKVRSAAIKALAAVPGALDKKKFVALLASEDPKLVLLAAETLRRMDDPAGLEAVLALAAAAGGDRAEAVRVLGGFRDGRAVPPLLDAAGAADLAVRRNAVSALQQLLPDLYPYKRFDLERAGLRADGPEAQRAEGLRLLRAWWDAHQPK